MPLSFKFCSFFITLLRSRSLQVPAYYIALKQLLMEHASYSTIDRVPVALHTASSPARITPCGAVGVVGGVVGGVLVKAEGGTTGVGSTAVVTGGIAAGVVSGAVCGVAGGAA